jgi:pSer/pThr/pTyr-binding forkhead associated (FHA) protein
MSDAAMLFAPPQPPLRLELGAEVVIGRSAECALRLPSSEASRRHAVVGWRGECAVVRDLGSTNGTRLNGARLEGERALEPGDRIEIGGYAITFCRVDDGLARPEAVASDRTQVALHTPLAKPPPSALRGDLAKIPLFAVLQMLEMGGQSGCLVVDAADGECALWMVNGRVVHAETPKARGMEAALSLAQLAAGRFEFTPGSPSPERAFDASVTEVILEASRLLDEARGL